MSSLADNQTFAYLVIVLRVEIPHGVVEVTLPVFGEVDSSWFFSPSNGFLVLDEVVSESIPVNRILLLVNVAVLNSMFKIGCSSLFSVAVE